MVRAPDHILRSAIAIRVPEAEALVAPFRAKHDPSAAAGMSAHITLLYPFLPPDEIDEGVLNRLGKTVRQFAVFNFSLAAIRQFDPGVLYLAPEPDEQFRRMTLAIWQAWLQSLPYSGQYAEIIPHLTIAEVSTTRLRDRIAIDFAQAAAGKLPIRARATAATLLGKRSERWRVRADLPLNLPPT
jgi:2'-5' RNA ligase